MTHITFIHGISNKPAPDKLIKIWRESLAQDLLGNDDALDLSTQGVSSSMVYWADVLYEKPLEEAALENVAMLESNDAVVAQEPGDPDMAWRGQISGEERQMVNALAAKLSFDMLVDDTYTPAPPEMDKKLERIPLPWFVKRRLMKQLLRDVHHYLFDFRHSPRPGATFQVQQEIRKRMLEGLRQGTGKPGPHVVVSHSMGTVIAYDCLRRVPDCPAVDAFLTIGSPLGMDEIQDKFKPEWSRENGFPGKVRGSWVNVYDSLDPVTVFDGNIANDYKKSGNEVIEVINEQNWGAWRHNITNYLSGPKLRAALRKQLGI